MAHLDIHSFLSVSDSDLRRHASDLAKQAAIEIGVPRSSVWVLEKASKRAGSFLIHNPGLFKETCIALLSNKNQEKLNQIDKLKNAFASQSCVIIPSKEATVENPATLRFDPQNGWRLLINEAIFTANLDVALRGYLHEFGALWFLRNQQKRRLEENEPFDLQAERNKLSLEYENEVRPKYGITHVLDQLVVDATKPNRS